MLDDERTSESGVSVVELIIVTSLLGIVLSFCMGALFSVQNTVQRTDLRSQNLDGARLAVQDLDRQIRSGNILYDPSLEAAGVAGTGVASGFSLRVYTQANGNQRCVQWRIKSGRLETRSWSEFWTVDGNVSEWRTVSDNVVNGSTTPPFSLASGASFAGRLLNVKFQVRQSSAAGNVTQVASSITGRNTAYGYNQAVCQTVPTP